VATEIHVIAVEQTWQPVELPGPSGWAPWRGPRHVVDPGAVWLVLDLRQGRFHAHVRLPGQTASPLPGEHHRAAVVLPGDPLPVSRPYFVAPEAIAVAAEAVEPRQVNDLLDQLAPLAQHVVNGMVAVPGTDDQDWTARALDAVDLLAARAAPGTYRRRHRYRDAADLFENQPELVDRAWAGMTDAQLNSAAAGLMDAVDDHRQPVRTVGIRAWLYGYRHRSVRDLQGYAPAQWAR